jgi:hypothetical membrane protein
MKKIDTFILQHKLAAWAGMIGSVLFVVVFTIEGWLRPGYNPLRMYVSDLSLGPRGWIQMVNFIIWGLLFLIFTRGVANEFKEGKASKAGPILLTIIAFSFFISGFFSTDPGTILTYQMSWHGILHGIFGALVFSLAPVSCFVFYRRFREDSKWQSLSRWTLAACIIIVVSVVFMKIGQLPLNPLNAWVGLIQRIALITYLGWIFTFALALHRRSK